MTKQSRIRKHVCDRCRDLFFKPRKEIGVFVPVGSAGTANKEGRKFDWVYRIITDDAELVPQSVCDDVGCRFGTTWGQLADQKFTKKELMGVVDEVLSERER